MIKLLVLILIAFQTNLIVQKLSIHSNVYFTNITPLQNPNVFLINDSIEPISNFEFLFLCGHRPSAHRIGYWSQLSKNLRNIAISLTRVT